MRARLPLVVLCLMLSPAEAAIWTVGGNSAACDFTDLGQAISAAAADPDPMPVIRIARDQTYLDVAEDIVGHDMVLAGGFSSCNDSTPSGLTTLDGAGAVNRDTVIDIRGGSVPYDVVLRDLLIVNGDPGALNFGGGVSILGTAHVTLENVTVQENTSDLGGGIFIDAGAGAELRVDADSLVWFNKANQEGGGIHCVNAVDPQSFADSAVRVSGIIERNEAVNGGGVYLDHCGYQHEAEGPGAGIFSNTATGSGGAIYATRDSLAVLSGDRFDDDQVTLSFNQATADGGAVYLTGDSDLNASIARLRRNDAGARGGAVFMDSGSAAFFGGRCGLDRCSSLELNTAGTEGGAIYHLDGFVQLERTWLYGNGAPDGSGIKSEGGTITMDGVIAARNETATTVLRLKNGNYIGRGMTFAENTDLIATIMTTGADFKLFGSIFADTVGNGFTNFGAASTVELRCLLYPPGTMVVGESLISGDAQFLDPSADDYRIAKTSSAVDYCEYFGTPIIKGPIDLFGPYLDLFGVERGDDVSDIPDVFGPYDLGAAEYRETLFSNGFETSFILQ